MTQYPGYIVPTGDFIQEWMEDNDINGAELSRRLDVSRKHVSELLHGKAPLSHEMALKLEYVTGVPARIWNLHEAGSRETLARQRSEQDLVNQYERARDFPLAYLRKCGFITAAPRDKTRTVQQLLQFFGLGTLDAFQPTWEKSAVAYRRSAIGREDVCALATWLHVAERTAALDSLPDYSRSTMEAALPELRSLTIGEPSEAIREAQRHLRDCGVALALVPAVRGLGIHGATCGRVMISCGSHSSTKSRTSFSMTLRASISRTPGMRQKKKLMSMLCDCWCPRSTRRNYLLSVISPRCSAWLKS